MRGRFDHRQGRTESMMTSSNWEENSKMSGNGPVFFLVQQQAKSIVAIQELQSRMTVLEGLQGRLMQAIKDIRQHLTHSGKRSVLKVASDSSVHAKSSRRKSIVLKSSPDIASSSSKNQLQELEDPLKLNSSEEEDWSQSAKNFANDAKHKSDSFNKDSGIGGDSILPEPAEEEDDELLQLLDLIDQKSLVLLKQVGQATDERKGTMHCSKEYSQSLDHLLFERVESQRQLSEVRAERDELRQRLAELESATEAVLKEKRKVQESLQATLSEKHSLEEKMQKSLGAGPRSLQKFGYLADIEKANVKKKYLQYSEKSRRRVSSVLKETSILELQKQLLTYIMENDVLRAKLEQDEPTRLSNWLRVESRLKEELKESKEENESLHRVIEMKDLEIASLRKRIESMEEAMENETCIKNFGLGSADDWRDPGVQNNNPYTKMSNLNNAGTNCSPLGYGDFSKTQSLPVMLLKESAKLNHQELKQQYGPIFDTGSFTEVPLNHSFDSCAPSRAMDNPVTDLVDLSDGHSSTYSTMDNVVQNHQQSRYLIKSSTSGLSSTPNLTSSSSLRRDNWELRHKGMADLGAKLVNGHLCWKGMSKDISSICTEFDPLSETPSCENFVDSLNLSIPLKPTQIPVASSQLSSIGDSLHSASLDLGCASSAICQDSRVKNIQYTRSVDGIRELLLEDNVYAKNRTQYKHHHTTVNHQRPVAVVKNERRRNCSHAYSDYSLL